MAAVSLSLLFLMALMLFEFLVTLLLLAPQLLLLPTAADIVTVAGIPDVIAFLLWLHP